MKDGLYSVHVKLGDGQAGKGSGVLVFRDGRMLGGDAFLFYVGCYEVRGNALTGEAVINQHTPSPGKMPLFGGQEVGVGFRGEVDGDRVTMHGTALVGRMSLAFHATLRRLAEATGEAGVLTESG